MYNIAKKGISDERNEWELHDENSCKNLWRLENKRFMISLCIFRNEEKNPISYEKC